MLIWRRCTSPFFRYSRKTTGGLYHPFAVRGFNWDGSLIVTVRMPKCYTFCLEAYHRLNLYVFHRIISRLSRVFALIQCRSGSEFKFPSVSWENKISDSSQNMHTLNVLCPLAWLAPGRQAAWRDLTWWEVIIPVHKLAARWSQLSETGRVRLRQAR